MKRASAVDRWRAHSVAWKVFSLTIASFGLGFVLTVVAVFTSRHCPGFALGVGLTGVGFGFLSAVLLAVSIIALVVQTGRPKRPELPRSAQRRFRGL